MSGLARAWSRHSFNSFQASSEGHKHYQLELRFGRVENPALAAMPSPQRHPLARRNITSNDVVYHSHSID